MAEPILVFSNLAAAATMTGSTEDAIYVAANAKSPQRPFRPWRTTATSQQTLVINLGSSQNWDAVFINRTNWTAGEIEAHPSDSWGAPDYNPSAITVARNPINHRYCHLHLTPSTRTEQYIRIVISAQTPVAEGQTPGGVGYFLTGGVYVGLKTAPPRHFRWGMRVETQEPRQDIVPEHRGWRQRLQRGEPVAKLDVNRIAGVTTLTPMTGDELDSAQEIERQSLAADYFLMGMNFGDTAQAWILRRMDDPGWSIDASLAEGSVVFEEVVR